MPYQGAGLFKNSGPICTSKLYVWIFRRYMLQVSQDHDRVLTIWFVDTDHN